MLLTVVKKIRTVRRQVCNEVVAAHTHPQELVRHQLWPHVNCCAMTHGRPSTAERDSEREERRERGYVPWKCDEDLPVNGRVEDLEKIHFGKLGGREII